MDYYKALPPGFFDFPTALPSFVGAVAHDSPLQILIDEDFLFIFFCIFSLQIHIAKKFNGRLEAFMMKIRD